EAFQRTIKRSMPEAELWVVMDDAVQAPGVRSYSNLSTEALADLYRRAWVFCLPSSYEGFGRPYAEALASGTAVVSTPNAGALEVLAGGRYGVITSAGRLGESVLALLRDCARRKRLAEAGLLRAQDFEWDRVVDRYEAVYAAVVGRRRTRKG